MKISSRDYCRNFVREKDYNLYLLHFFMPRAVREHALAFMALHCELISITDKTADMSMRIIRLKWWYDSVIALFNGNATQDSPILESLYPAHVDKVIQREECENYLSEVEKLLRDEENDCERYVTEILTHMIASERQRKRFKKIIESHQSMGDYSALRPLRLWICYIKHR